MNSSDGDTCEILVGKEWIEISIERALGFHPATPKRCAGCHGRVRVHQASSDGTRAHFEHLDAHPGCSRGSDRYGAKRRHSGATNAPPTSTASPKTS